MEDLTITNFKKYIQFAPEKTLKQLSNMISNEQERRKKEVKYIDTHMLRDIIKNLYPFIFSKKRDNGKVAYRMAIACVLHKFTDTYNNLNVSNISQFIDMDRTSTYHYLRLKQGINLPGYELNKQAYEDAKRDLIPIIKSGQLDLKP